MPWKIKKSGDKFEVVNESTGKSAGVSDSLDMAKRHLAALYANTPDAKASDYDWSDFVEAGAPQGNRNASGPHRRITTQEMVDRVHDRLQRQRNQAESSRWDKGASRFNKYGEGRTSTTTGKHISEFENEDLNHAELKQKLESHQEAHEDDLATEVKQHIAKMKSHFKISASDEENQPNTVMAESLSGYLVDKNGEQHLPTKSGGKISWSHVGAAWAALHGGYRGNKYEGPDKESAIAKLKKIYENAGKPVPATDKSDAAFNVINAVEHKGTITADHHLHKMRKAVNEAIQEDPRFDLDKHGYAEGSPGDRANEPYVVDILSPDKDGDHQAVIRRDDGKLVKHGFDYDHKKGEATMHEGEPEDCEQTSVYSNAVEEADNWVAATDNLEPTDMEWIEAGTPIKAKGTADGGAKRSASSKSDKANSASQDAHESSMAAHESGEDEDHEAAADAHDKAADAHKDAMLAHAKAGNADQAHDHARHMTAHETAANAHRRGEAPVEARMAAEAKNEVKCFNFAGTKLPSQPWVAGKDVSFIYAPGGTHTITAGFRKDDSITMTVEVDSGTADRLNDYFGYLTATHPKQEPYGDEDHEGHKATLRFPVNATRFEMGKIGEDEGVIVKGGQPTTYGAESVNGKVYRSWSPTFLTDADYTKAKKNKGHYSFPEGVRGSESNPARIIGMSFVAGALTNQPAFKAMPPVKAHDPQHKMTLDDAFVAASKPTALETALAAVPKPTKPKVLTLEDAFKQISAKPGGTGSP